MAPNFKISVHRNGDELNLVMQGNFDGTSACELLNVLKNECNGVDTVVIGTSGLKEIYPFGRDTFQINLYILKSQPIRLVFTGNNATQIHPNEAGSAKSCSTMEFIGAVSKPFSLVCLAFFDPPEAD